jgi:hypothetical protein
MGADRGAQPVNRMQTQNGNIVQLLCDLSETSDEVFRGSMVESGSRTDLRLLTKFGAISPGPRPDTVTCAACDADHPGVLDFDTDRQCYFYFCPEAGLVTVRDADLITHRYRPEWLVDWLATALHVPSPLDWRALVPSRVWHLGDALCGDTLVTVMFARRVIAQAELDQLASALRPIYRADKGLVVTTSLNVARQVALPGGYELLPLPEIVSAGPDGLALDTVRLGSWIRGMQPTTAKGAPTRVGRPSPNAGILRIYNSRRSRGLPVDNDSAEARAILAEWPQHAPEQDPPGFSTVRGHVGRLAKAIVSP